MSNIIAILSGLSFYLIPVTLGGGILATIGFFKTKEYEHHDLAHNIIELFKYFIFGALFIFGAALTVSHLSENFVATLKTVLFISLGISIALIGISFVKKIISRKIVITPTKLLLFLGLFVLAMSVYKVWRWDSPLNTTLDWDLYEHQTIINLMSDGNFEFSPLNMSDTFQFYSYSTFFHTLAAIPQFFFQNVNVLHFWWYAQFFHFFVTILASYTIAYSVTKRRWVGIISALIGAFTFESFVAYTSLFLLPQTLAATAITLFTANTILHFKDHEPIIDLTTVALSSFILLNHMIIGLAGTGIILFNIAYLKLFKDKGKVKTHRALLLFFIALLISFPFITKGIDLSFLNRGEAAYFTLNLRTKYEYMKNFYGFLALGFFPIGLYYIYSKGKTDATLLGLVTLGTLAIVIGNLPYVLKFYTIGRFFVHTVMAMGIWELIKRSPTYIRIIGVSLLFPILFIIFSLNIYTFKQTPSHNGISTHVTDNEIEAAEFIKETYSEQEVIIISEPATMYILEGLSGVNSPGGVFTDINTRHTVSSIYFSRDSELMQYEIFGAKDTLPSVESPEKALLVISGRFSKWQNAGESQKFGIYWNVWQPADISLAEYDFIEFIEENTNFSLVFKNPGLRIYEIDKLQ